MVKNYLKRYLTKEENVVADDLEGFYRVPADNRDLNYDKYFEDGDKKLSSDEEYNSHNTDRLTIEQIKDKATNCLIFNDELKGWNNS